MKSAKIIMLNYTYCHPEKIEFFEDNNPLYDVDVEDDHSFLIEGGYVVHNSAGGTAVAARDRTFQAILPLRGKVLNVGKTTLNKALENNEIGTIVSALGVQTNGKEVRMEDLRYHKIILMCHTGETTIPLLDGRTLTIQELSEGKAGNQFWVYSIDQKNGKMVPGLACLPRQTGEVSELIEIVFDDGFVTRCTPNHKWVSNDGSEILAKDLSVGDGIMSLYRKNDAAGYEKIYDPTQARTNKWVHTHTLVASEVWPDEQDACGEFCLTHGTHISRRFRHPVVHHSDFNKHNNRPENLFWQPCWEHFDNHSALGKDTIVRYNKSQKHKRRISKLHKAGFYSKYTWASTYNGSERHLIAIANAFKDELTRTKMMLGFGQYRGSQKNKDVASKKKKKMWQDGAYRANTFSDLPTPHQR